MNTINSHSIVQVIAERFHKGQPVLFERLKDMVPCHSSFDKLTDALGCSEQPCASVLPTDERTFKEAAFGMTFHSVGEPTGGHPSCFEYTRSQQSLEEMVAPYHTKFVTYCKQHFQAAQNARTVSSNIVSILTLWGSAVWMDRTGKIVTDNQFRGILNMNVLTDNLLDRQ